MKNKIISIIYNDILVCKLKRIDKNSFQFMNMNDNFRGEISQDTTKEKYGFLFENVKFKFYSRQCPDKLENYGYTELYLPGYDERYDDEIIKINSLGRINLLFSNNIVIKNNEK